MNDKISKRAVVMKAGLQSDVTRSAWPVALAAIFLWGAANPASAAFGGESTLQTIVAQDSASFSLSQAISPQSTVTSGLAITLNQGTGLLANTAAAAAFNRVAQFYASRLTDPVNLVIDVNLAQLSSGVLGSTSTTSYYGDYNLIRNAVVADQSAHGRPGDITNFLPTASEFSAYVPSGFSIGGLSLSSANAKALGFSVHPSRDASITFSTAYNYDFNPGDGITPGSFDFEGIVRHEFGHALGFLSAVDSVDYMLTNNLSGVLYPSTLDLFRLKPGAGNTDFTHSPRVMVTGDFTGFGEQVSYFGTGEEFKMSTGVDHGDGHQASHWKDNMGMGIMDPTLAPGETGGFSYADLRSFDVIGWDVAAVPLPAAAWLLGPGLIGIMGFARRGKTAS